MICCVDKVKSPDVNNIVIIGDSFIALEICGWLTTGLEEKKNVSVVMRSKVPMIRILGEKVGQALQKVHEKNGAKFFSSATVTEITVQFVICFKKSNIYLSYYFRVITTLLNLFR